MLRFLINKIRALMQQWRKHQSIVTIKISKSALLNNLYTLQSLVPQWQIAPVLKSNAYGHGLVLIAGILEKEKNIPFFCIDSYFEAELIRNAGIKTPLLIIGYTLTTMIQKNKLKNIFFTIGSLEQLKTLITLKTRQTIHLKFDTGMHRQGISYAKLNEIIDILSQKITLQINGIMSHLADADNPNSKFTKLQIEQWNKLAKQFQKNFSNIRSYHLANSAGFACAKNMTANVGRTGIALYGINPKNLLAKFQPVLQMNSIISEIKTIEQNESVGYNGTFTAQHKMKIAIAPAGYFEGVDRRLSNQGCFLIKNKKALLCGLINMNISCCDVTDIIDATIDSPVNIISHHSEDQNSIENIAKLCNTISYEILAHIPAHLRRIIIK